MSSVRPDRSAAGAARNSWPRCPPPATPPAQEQADRLCRAFAAHDWPGVGHLTVSIGLTVTRPGDTLPALITRADHALYCAKAAGRNGWKADTDPHPG